MEYFVDLAIKYTYGEETDFVHESKMSIKCDSITKAFNLVDLLNDGCDLVIDEKCPKGWSASLRIEKGDETDGE